MSREHGTRSRYNTDGCRCEDCRRANTIYEARRAARRSKHGPALVDNTEARDHLAWLASQGVGLMATAEATGLSWMGLRRIARGEVTRSRIATVDAILSVSRLAVKPGAHVDARPTRKLLADLRSAGHLDKDIAVMLGCRAKVPALRVGKSGLVKARTARKVEALHWELLRPAATSTQPSQPSEGPDAPWADVEAWIIGHTGAVPTHRVADQDREYRHTISDREVAELVGVSHRTVQRWRARGTIPAATLEDIADRLRVHPSELWSGWVDALIESTAA